MSVCTDTQLTELSENMNVRRLHCNLVGASQPEPNSEKASTQESGHCILKLFTFLHLISSFYFRPQTTLSLSGDFC